MMKRVFNYAVISTICMLLFGCGVFTASKRLDLSPFANSMISVAGEIQYSLLQHQSPRLRARLTPGPATKKFQIRKEKMRNIIKSIISYSIQIVTLGESNISDKKKAAGLADYLEGIKKPVLKNPEPELNLTQAQIDQIISDVRNQKNLLDAIAAAQPLINEVATEMGDLSDEAKIFLDEGQAEVAQQWKSEYEAILWSDSELQDSQMRSIKALYHLKQYRFGVRTDIDSVYITDPQLREVVKTGKKITSADLAKLEDRLLYKLSKVSEMRKQFSSDITAYYQGIEELNGTHGAYNRALRDARNAVILWSRAHNSLGKGVTEPAQIDLLGLMLNTAKKLAPVPL